jgi:predicted metal-dependent hydrolase
MKPSLVPKKDRGLRENGGASVTVISDYDRLYVKFVYYFNIERDYFECHEVMEELWLEEGRSLLYQGLLQVAVGLYHYRNGNVSGAMKLFTAALEKLEGRQAELMGIDLGRLVADSKRYLSQLERLEEEPFAFYDLDIRVIDPVLDELVDVLKANPPIAGEDEEEHE